MTNEKIVKPLYFILLILFFPVIGFAQIQGSVRDSLNGSIHNWGGF